MTLKDRILKFIEFKGLTIQSFEKSVGLSNAAVSKMGDNTRKGTLDKVSKAFPELNRVWLLTGEGDMIRNREATVSHEPLPDDYFTVLLPESAYGGPLTGFSAEGVVPDNCPRVVSPLPGVDYALPVIGDSMAPEYPNGSRIFVRRVDSALFIQWGDVFVLDTDNGVIIKKVVRSDDDSCVRCVSLNPDPDYAPFDVPKECIRGMYRVVGCFAMK